MLKNGASLLRRRALVVNGENQSTNSLLTLMEHGRLIQVKLLLEYYQNNPDKICDTNPHNIYPKSPLCYAIECGADYELTLFMLEFGFRTDELNQSLDEVYTSKKIEAAASVRTNIAALSALVVFSANKLAKLETKLKESTSVASKITLGVMSKGNSNNNNIESNRDEAVNNDFKPH